MKRAISSRQYVSVALSLSIAVLLLLGTTPALAAYPSPTPDFAHPSEPHHALFTPTSGHDSRPLLIIYRLFEDTYGYTPVARFEEMIFGSDYPSVADYFEEVSFGKFSFYPAAETQGDVNDGMVLVTRSTIAEYEAMSQEERGKTALEAADPSVDFSVFDENGDGAITADELCVVQIFVEPYEIDGGARSISPVTLDGVRLETMGWMAYMPHTWTLEVYAHELMHVAFRARDTYGFGTGRLDLMGVSGGYVAPSTWHKLHLGWTDPQVVTRDGYYTVWDAYGQNFAYILYDPERGTDDYFLVENRQRTTGDYDDDIADEGLVIWRVDETQYWSKDGNLRPIELMRPDGTTTPPCIGGGCYGGSRQDAWDPSDFFTCQRTMDRPWRDGTDSGVAVRAISASDLAMKVYFDVPGPGVLVDTADVTGRPKEFQAWPGQSLTVPFSLMNTGESSGTFLSEMSFVPAGWHATNRVDELDPGQDKAVTLHVQIPSGTEEGTYLLRVRGQSAGDALVNSISEVYVEVTSHASTIKYTGASVLPVDEPLSLRAKVTDPEETLYGLPAPIEDAIVTFEIEAPGGTLTFTATTSINGVATVTPSPVPDLLSGTYGLTVSVPRTGIHEPASTSGQIEVIKHEVKVFYDGVETIPAGGYGLVKAWLSDQTKQGRKVEGVPVTFTIGSGAEALTVTASTESDGAAYAHLWMELPPGTYPIAVSTEETDVYLAARTSAEIELRKHVTTLQYTGASGAPWGEPAGFAAKLADSSLSSWSMEGLSVTFELMENEEILLTQTVAAGEDGVAGANLSLGGIQPGTYDLRVSTPGDGLHLPTSRTLSYVVEKRPVAIRYTGDTMGEYSDAATLKAEMTDGLSGAPVAGKAVRFSVGGLSLEETTAEDGTATASVVITQPSGALAVAAGFAGDDFYLPAAAASSLEVAKEDALVVYAGDVLVESGGSIRLAVQATEEDDGYPGDLGLAQVEVTLTATLSGSSLSYVISLDEAGTGAITVKDGLAADLWTISVAIPADNAYWQSGPPLTASLAVFDPSRSLTAGLVGYDAAGARLRLAGSARYPNGELKLEMRGQVGGRTFASTSAHWFVAAGDEAILEFNALWGGTPVTAQLSVSTSDIDSTMECSLVLWTADAVVYDSGVISAGGGRLVLG